MAKLKLGAIADDKPVKLTIELRQRCIGISLLTRRCFQKKPANLRMIQQG